jgi:translation initiation factor IF-1
MSFRINKVLTGAALALLSCLGVIHASSAAMYFEPRLETPINPNEPIRLGVTNQENIPRLAREVRGQITEMDGNRVTINVDDTDGRSRTYRIPEWAQEYYELQTGDRVIFLTRAGTVISIARIPEPPPPPVVQVRPAPRPTPPPPPAPLPPPAPRPAPPPPQAPVRGLW